MRVLIYVEPYPIRDTGSHFSDVARGFLPLLTSVHGMDIRMFSSNGTFQPIGDAKLAAYKTRLIRTTPAEQALIDSHVQPWQSSGMPTWLDLMAGKGDVAEDYLGILRRIWNAFPFDVIIHWGENGAITRFLDERPVTRIAMELGCTRPPFFDSIVMDPFGTNGSGVIPKLTLEDLRGIVGNRPLSSDEALNGYALNLEPKAYEERFQPLPPDLSAQITGDKLAFLALQLFDDANLLRFSPYDTVMDVVQDVVPRLAEAGYTTIIKSHPASKHRKGSIVANNLARASLLSKYGNSIVWTDALETVSNAKLAAMADFVVTVNSSVGFEALYFDKPVVVLGDAVYKPKDLFPTIDDMLSGRFDEKRYRDGTGLLRRFILGGYLQPQRLRDDPTSFAARVGLIDQISRQAPNDPVAFARTYWNAVSPAQQAVAESAMMRGISVPGQQEFGVPAIKADPGNARASNPVAGYMPVASRILAHAGTTDLESFRAWLEPRWATPEGRAPLINIGKLVDHAYYLKTYPGVKDAGMDPHSHFCNRGFVEKRSPRAAIPGTSAEGAFEYLIEAAEVVLGGLSVPVHPLEDEDETTRQAQYAAVKSALSQSANTTAVVAHLYYRDLVPQILDMLGAIREPFDLILTLPTWGTRRIKEMVREKYPAAIFYDAANRGRDIGPFVDLLPIFIEKNYDAVLKLQTKRGYYSGSRFVPVLGDIWRDEAFEALMGSETRVADILNAFRSQPNLNMVGPEPYLMSLKEYPYHDGGYLAEELLEGAEGDEGAFFAGTMFWVRPSALAALAKLRLTHFAPESGANDGVLAHLVERMFGHAAGLGAGSVIAAPVDPAATLVDDPAPMEHTLKTYLNDRFDERRQARDEAEKGALQW